ncbi:serine hydrolase domain-containing protein [Streptomyces sp. 8L]|uniref:serine hydrolase domain-containing protein n=1 Tax=Streptomyces sp. 8L TaxID=2877242 RepID=UPI0027DFAECB|nr:serine hydrolase domain-containing protein [Streptomyces sp. 8L]
MELGLVSARLREMTHDHSVPGAQLTVCHAGSTLSAVSGVTRVGMTDPVTAETAFAFGSVTKVFTATLVAQLVSEGDLEWDDPVDEYVAEFDGAMDEAFSSVTLRNLLSHTAGLVADHELEDFDEASLARYAAGIASTRILHEPGHCFSYSNSGYNVLGRVIEAVTGMKWQAVLENRLLRPLGIDPVFVHGPLGQRALADGHAVRPGDRRTARPVGLFLPRSWAPASGLAGSADDLVALATLHLGSHPDSGALLPAKQRTEMAARTPGADAFGMADGWGLGLAHYASPDGPWLGHDGTVDGGTAHVRWQPAGDTAVALTTNATTGTLMWSDLVGTLRELGLPVGDYHPGAPGTPALTSALEGFTGDYRNGDTAFSVRLHREDTLRLTDATGLTADLALHDDLGFTARRTDTDTAPYTGRFVTDPATGDVTLMQLGGRSARRTTTL